MPLTFTLLLLDSFANKIVIFLLLLFMKIGFDISCKVSLKETICIKCTCLFSGKN